MKGFSMGAFNSQKNRAVWFDVPVANLDRAIEFYQAVLAVRVDRLGGDTPCGVIDHQEGNGGCLVEGKEEIGAGGVLVYLNVNGRIRDAIGKVVPQGGSIIHDVHSIAPHGVRAVILDSEGNRVALHSEFDD